MDLKYFWKYSLRQPYYYKLWRLLWCDRKVWTFLIFWNKMKNRIEQKRAFNVVPSVPLSFFTISFKISQVVCYGRRTFGISWPNHYWLWMDTSANMKTPDPKAPNNSFVERYVHKYLDCHSRNYELYSDSIGPPFNGRPSVQQTRDSYLCLSLLLASCSKCYSYFIILI